jgi:hypothetical protein
MKIPCVECSFRNDNNCLTENVMKRNIRFAKLGYPLKCCKDNSKFCKGYLIFCHNIGVLKEHLYLYGQSLESLGISIYPLTPRSEEEYLDLAVENPDELYYSNVDISNINKEAFFKKIISMGSTIHPIESHKKYIKI